MKDRGKEMENIFFCLEITADRQTDRQTDLETTFVLYIVANYLKARLLFPPHMPTCLTSSSFSIIQYDALLLAQG